jgi:hypothetical protein
MKYLIQSLNINESNMHLVEFSIEQKIVKDSDNKFIQLVMEIPQYISHWDNFELKLFYEWIFLYKRYIPLNFENLVDEWIEKEREDQISIMAGILQSDLSYIEDIKDFNKCLELLKVKVNKIRS